MATETRPARVPLTRPYNEISEFFDRFAAEEDRWLRRTGGYHALVGGICRSVVPAGQRVLEIGCGRGDLLASLAPGRGVGVDVSPGMVAAARQRHPSLEFVCMAGEDLDLDEEFDYIVLSDVIPYAEDLQALFAAVARHCHPRTRLIVSTYSNVWRPLLAVLTKLRLRPRRPTRNWVGPKDLINLVELGGMQVTTQRKEILLPLRVPLLSRLCNGYLARLPLFRGLALTHWLVARPLPRDSDELSVSVIVPARNEAGSISELVERIPEMGLGTEVIFVEGGSEDDTQARIAAEIERRPDRDLRLLVQTGKGKWNAVQEGFAAASNDILMILDGDMTVPPEDLPKFYEAVARGHGELINGSRLVYGMETGAMRFLNMLGNKFFAWLLSFVLGQYVKDTLCGTKALRRDDYERIARRRHEFGVTDPFGDFDLLLGSALLGLKISNVPVRYRARIYGDTNIRRFSSGGTLLRLALAGYRRIWVLPVDVNRSGLPTPSLSEGLQVQRAAWDTRPALRSLYEEWFGMVAERLSGVPGPTVELGAGIGAFKEFYPGVTATDIEPTPWADEVVDAEAMPYDDGSVANLVLIDTLHHLPHPLRFFDEARRVLAPGGRVVMLEPYASPLSTVAFRLGHHEEMDPRADPFLDTALSSAQPLDANNAVPTLIFWRHAEIFAQRYPELQVIHRSRFAFLAYLLSSGFTKPPVAPAWLIRMVQRSERALPWPGPMAAFRCLVVIEKPLVSGQPET